MLTSYDGKTITADEIGNLLTDGTWTYTWEHGRELVSMSKSEELEDTTITFQYDANGMRTTKTVTTNTYHAHTYTSVVTSPTCTEYGYTTHTCDCGYCYHSNAVAALGHDLESINTNDVQIYECSRCGYHYIDHTHSYFATLIKPTCTTDGYTLYECGCGYYYESDSIAALGHLYDSLKDMVCNRCGYNRGGTVVTPPLNPGTTSTASAQTQTVAQTDRVIESTVVETHSYVYNGGQLMQEVIVTAATVDGTTTTTTETLNFTYDAAGTALSVTYNNDTYYYVTNIQGDVLAIVDTSGTSVVTYSYDAWGNHLSTTGSLVTTLGEANPLRYRGYVYDQETNLYYLQSRYYDPAVGRFINADSYASTGQDILGNNMFTYCLNNPVYYSDPDGDIAVPAFVWTALIDGISSFFCELIKTGSLIEATKSFANTFVVGLLSGFFKPIEIIYGIYQAVGVYVDCYQSGMSQTDALMVAAGSFAIDQISFGSTGDLLTDNMVDLAFGTGIDVMAEGARSSMKNYSEDNRIVFTPSRNTSNTKTSTHNNRFKMCGGGKRIFLRTSFSIGWTL